jgi:enterochelin esterase-like enzyme
MTKRIVALVACSLLACPTVPALAQPGDAKQDDQAERFPAPPAGFDARRDGIDRGKLETVEYDSTTVGIKRKARVYTPPGYTTDHKYPSWTCSTASAATKTSGPAAACPT